MRLGRHTLRSMGASVTPTMHVGSKGITQMIVDELKRQLRNETLIKVKILRNCGMDRMEAANKLAELSGCGLLEVRGNTATYCKKALIL